MAATKEAKQSRLREFRDAEAQGPEGLWDMLGGRVSAGQELDEVSV